MAWMYRHRVQHETGKPVDDITSDRFATQFEQALKARGNDAKEAFFKKHPWLRPSEERVHRWHSRS
jgi:hypothetical protein